MEHITARSSMGMKYRGRPAAKWVFSMVLSICQGRHAQETTGLYPEIRSKHQAVSSVMVLDYTQFQHEA